MADTLGRKENQEGSLDNDKEGLVLRPEWPEFSLNSTVDGTHGALHVGRRKGPITGHHLRPMSTGRACPAPGTPQV